MNKPSHHVHHFDAAPAEPDDPRNTLLDAFEQFVEALVDNDMALQARLRFERHIPAQPSVAHPHPALSRAHSNDAQKAFAAAGSLGLTALLAELKRLEKLKMNALAHQAVQAVKAEAEAALAGFVNGERKSDV